MGSGRRAREIIKREHIEHIAATIQGARLVILPNVSHFALLQDPPAFNDAILSFLGKPQASASAPKGPSKQAPKGALKQGSRGADATIEGGAEVGSSLNMREF